eukprot:gene30047-39241_t
MSESKRLHDGEEEKGSPSRNRAEAKFVPDDDDGEEFKEDAKVTSNQQENYVDAKISDEEEMMSLIGKVQEYFFGSEILANTFEDFVKERSDIIDLKTEEYKLEYTAVFNEYKALFESKMEKYLEDILHSTPRKFYLALKHFRDKDEYSNESIFAQILVAVTDFDVFMTMMKEAAIEKQSEYGRK